MLFREIINRWTCVVFFSLSKTIPLEGCHLRLSGKEINQSEIFESEYNECTYENIPSECYTVMSHQIPGNWKAL